MNHYLISKVAYKVVDIDTFINMKILSKNYNNMCLPNHMLKKYISGPNDFVECIFLLIRVNEFRVMITYYFNSKFRYFSKKTNAILQICTSTNNRCLYLESVNFCKVNSIDLINKTINCNIKSYLKIGKNNLQKLRENIFVVDKKRQVIYVLLPISKFLEYF
jgi:hypothetical protein